MKKLLLLISMFVLNQTNAQQNLVLNPSFEDVNYDFICSGFAPILFAQNWLSPNSNFTRIVNTGFDPSCTYHPLSDWCDQLPRTGNGFAALVNLYAPTTTHRQFIRGKLTQPMIVGQNYIIEFYVCLGQGSQFGSNNIGVKFINDNATPIYSAVYIPPFTPDLNYTGAPFTDFNNWTLFSFFYTPTQSNLDSFIIGNFYDDEATLVEYLPQGLNNHCTYILIDDVAVYALIPEFNFPSEICKGDELLFSNVSNNNVTGTWSPAPNNQQTTTYTFVPDDPHYSTGEVTIVVKPVVIPEFDEIGPFCDEVPNITALPTISNNGIEGTWSPIFNPNQTTTYTFTPNDTKCVETITKKIIIDKNPTFDTIEPFCEPDLNYSLPTISTNGISGSWSPTFDPYNSQTYTFTRDSGDCMQQVTLDIVVNAQLNFELFSYCKDDTYFIELIANNFSLSEIKNMQWLINNSSISETGNKIILSDYSNLLQEVNTIEIIFTDSNDCLHTKEIQVLSKNLCKIQKGISPNGDGLNEYFDLVSFGGVDLKIFNRYGNVVYENSNYKNEWHGQSKNGKELPSGTYFYQIQTNIGEQFTGYIQLTY